MEATLRPGGERVVVTAGVKDPPDQAGLVEEIVDYGVQVFVQAVHEDVADLLMEDIVIGVVL